MNISETVRDRGLVGSKGPPIGNCLWEIEWSHDHGNPERSNSWPQYA